MTKLQALCLAHNDAIQHSKGGKYRVIGNGAEMKVDGVWYRSIIYTDGESTYARKVTDMHNFKELPNAK